jgi:hypothetical protein
LYDGIRLASGTSLHGPDTFSSVHADRVHCRQTRVLCLLLRGPRDLRGAQGGPISDLFSAPPRVCRDRRALRLDGVDE